MESCHGGIIEGCLKAVIKDRVGIRDIKGRVQSRLERPQES